ncbi:MAG TPA: GNAT family N-acetyltransferase [Vicinamibacteria bacterium]|nr:GNAT family N-acetyltransferase [Vicinamibacteria bacterium]
MTALRTASPADAGAITAVINAAYQVERFFVDGDRIREDEVRRYMAKGTFLIAEQDGTPIGCVYAEQRGDRGYFGLLAVDPARHGKGVGRTLIEAAEARFLRAGCQAVDIQVVDLRTELPPFYRRLGYVETGTAPFSDPEKATRPCHFILMSKPLNENPSR